MEPGGWITMILSVGFVTVLFVYCVIRVLRGPQNPPEHYAHVEPIDEDEIDRR